MKMRVVSACATVFSLLAAAPVAAAPITLQPGDENQAFTFNFDGFSDGTDVDDLTSSVTFTLTSADANSYSFDYLVNNTTGSGGSGVESRVSSFSFNTNPTIDSASSSGDYSFIVLDSKYPNGIGSVDICFKAGKSGSCAGNKGGVASGESASGSLTLNFADRLSSLTLDDFFVRYQSVSGAGSVSSASGRATVSSSSGSSSSGGTSVPEPGMLGLFGLGLIGLGLYGNRRRRRDRGQRFAAA